jgi:hypothetical protein
MNYMALGIVLLVLGTGLLLVGLSLPYLTSEQNGFPFGWTIASLGLGAALLLVGAGSLVEGFLNPREPESTERQA